MAEGFDCCKVSQEARHCKVCGQDRGMEGFVNLSLGGDVLEAMCMHCFAAGIAWAARQAVAEAASEAFYKGVAEEKKRMAADAPAIVEAP
jgi:uncharacterized protein CbrC (UPF0167 family)